MSYPSYTIAVICYIEAHITDEKLNHDKLSQQIGFLWDHIREMFRRDTCYSIATVCADAQDKALCFRFDPYG